jgi:hypothetical protein
MGMTLVAPSLSQMPVAPSETFIIMCAKSHTAWPMSWYFAVMLLAAV